MGDEKDDPYHIPEELDATKRPPKAPPQPPKAAAPAPSIEKGPAPMRTQTTETTKTPKRIPVPPPKSAKVVSLRPAAKPAKPVAKKAAAPKAAPKPKADKPKTGIGAMARALILDGLDNEQVLAKVKKAFPAGNTVAHNISWYRMDLRRKGQLTDTAAGQRAAKKLGKAKKAPKAK